MELHFNPRGLFVGCVFLMLWQMMFSSALIVGVVGLSFYLGYLQRKNKLSWADIIFGGSFIVNLWYVARLGVDVRQYDYYSYFTHGMFYVENDFFIKNPMDYVRGAFYHPPLWGGIAGIVIKIGNLLGVEDVEAYDEVRYINLFAISGVCVIVFRFFELFKLKDCIKLWGWGLFCWFPIHTVLAGLNNNDPLMYFFMVCAMYQGYLWYSNGGGMKRSLVISGLVIGAGMTKLSGIMVIVYLSMLVLAKLINVKKFFDRKIWSEAFVIGMGAIIGFTWGWILLAYGEDIIPPPQNVAFISLEKFSLWKRLFDFSNILVVFSDVWNRGLEHNVWLALIKTFAFGEWEWEPYWACVVIYVLTILMAFLTVFSWCGIVKYQIGDDYGLNLAILVFSLVVMGLWALLWNRFPYFCSTEFRYIICLLPLAVLWMMNWVEQKNLPKFWLKLLASMIVLLMVCKTIVVVSTI